MLDEAVDQHAQPAGDKPPRNVTDVDLGRPTFVVSPPAASMILRKGIFAPLLPVSPPFDKTLNLLHVNYMWPTVHRRSDRIQAIVFDLLTALLDSWSVWNRAAGSAEHGLRWRRAYLRLTYGCGVYRPYEDLVREAAAEAGLEETHAAALTERWGELQPWPEVAAVLGDLTRRGLPLAVVTNCSVPLGRQAAARVGVPLAAVMTAEEAGFYKPRPEPYRALLAQLGTDPARTLFVAGSPADIPGASGVGMPVVWHNRAGLPFVAHDARPILVADTLHPLAELA